MSHGKLPAPLRDTVERLSALPGMGPKSALRAALEILRWPRERADALGASILELREKLCFCTRCKALSECDPCSICADPGRDASLLALVSDLDSLLVLEEGGIFGGRYMVLGGLLAPLDGMDANKLAFAELKERLAEGEVRELVLALGATADAEATSSYVKNLVESSFPMVQVTRLAQGIPLGAEVRYMDKETLRQSLAHRQKL
jgi:recombination protein RecR